MKDNSETPKIGKFEVTPETQKRHRKLARQTLDAANPHKREPLFSSNRDIILHASAVIDESRKRSITRLLERATDPEI